MCGSVYSYILGTRHYAPISISALLNFQKKRILTNIMCESQFSRLLVNLCENARQGYKYSVLPNSRWFSENRRMCGSAFRKNFTPYFYRIMRPKICLKFAFKSFKYILPQIISLCSTPSLPLHCSFLYPIIPFTTMIIQVHVSGEQGD